MKKVAHIIFLLFVMASLAACNCIEGEGEVETEYRDVSEFNRIELDNSSRVIFEIDSVYSLMAEAQPNILDILKTEVRGKTLRIYTGELCYNTRKPVTIFISMPEIKGIEVDGSGLVMSKRTFRSENMDLEVDGSGEIRLELVAREIEASISGSGDIDLAGRSDALEVDINGSGECYALNLETSGADIDISGSGSCKVFAKRELNADIRGSGTVYYKGSPEIETHISGSGKVSKMD